jgi:proteasome lid subunit RPN8/RPN11
MIFGIGGPAIHIPRHVYEEMVEHAKGDYPNECCGAIVGAIYKDKRVFESHRMRNINTERSSDRFIIDPNELNIIDKQARVANLDVIGFYHSHPDHPDKPSEYDREWAHPGYSYLIISIKGGDEVKARSWIVEEDEGSFKEEKIKITE